mmetsp:Transcript_43410/g.138513  ORF Transcript_43410/g.138513 Transcript_43410/m.138513 type:complete len:249 (-) Transcript_43410:69-815(-)
MPALLLRHMPVPPPVFRWPEGGRVIAGSFPTRPGAPLGAGWPLSVSPLRRTSRPRPRRCLAGGVSAASAASRGTVRVRPTSYRTPLPHARPAETPSSWQQRSGATRCAGSGRRVSWTNPRRGARTPTTSAGSAGRTSGWTPSASWAWWHSTCAFAARWTTCSDPTSTPSTPTVWRTPATGCPSGTRCPRAGWLPGPPRPLRTRKQPAASMTAAAGRHPYATGSPRFPAVLNFPLTHIPAAGTRRRSLK